MTEPLTLGTLAAALPMASFIAMAVLWILTRAQTRVRASHIGGRVAASEFRVGDGGAVVNSNQAVDPFPFGRASPPETWGALRHWLEPRFGSLPENFEEISKGESLKARAKEETDPGLVILKRDRNANSVTLIDLAAGDAAALHQVRIRDANLTFALKVLENAPCAMRCKHLSSGQIWENTTFASFSEADVDLFLAAAGSQNEDSVQISDTKTGQDTFYRVEKMTDADIEVLYLVEVTEAARAEKVRREFIQTLTKTFANLTAGLAVFDRHRQLALFNPALMDLTNLPAVFLSSRPTMTQFFDRLRDNKVLPEPKNYGTWRGKIEEMIRSASDGLYFEDWCLSNGETYRVAGRPHPDGAVAFLFEDISDEIALTRRFRGQIDVRQAALDTCHQAITVIGPANVVLLCNQPASAMLGIDPDSSFAEMSIHDFMQACSERLPHDRFWTTAEVKILERETAEAIIPDVSGREHLCTIKPIRGNSVLVSISETPDAAVASSEPRMLTA